MVALVVLSYGIVSTGFWDDVVADLYVAFGRQTPPTFVGWPMKGVFLLAVTLGAFMFYRPAIVRWWRTSQRRSSQTHRISRGLESLGYPQPDVREELADLRKVVETLSGLVAGLDSGAAKVGEIEEEIGRLRQGVRELSKLPQLITTLADQSDEADKGITLLLQYATSASNYFLLGRLIKEAPPKPPMPNRKSFDENEKFLHRITWQGLGQGRTIEYQIAIQDAKSRVEYELRGDNPPAAPEGVSPHDWRDWLISERQREAATTYFAKVRDEIEDGLAREYRPHLFGEKERRTKKA